MISYLATCTDSDAVGTGVLQVHSASILDPTPSRSLLGSLHVSHYMHQTLAFLGNPFMQLEAHAIRLVTSSVHRRYVSRTLRRPQQLQLAYLYAACRV